ncbi:MAG: CotH kinase family protein, partial [Clostridia bacterium]|nr:CotH kinase family protein [Clostridia bacterium]
GCTSWYLYLPAGSQRFVMGPVWDFDQSMEDPTLPLQCARSLAAAQRGEQLTVDESGMRAFLDLLCTQRSFVDLMAARLPSLAERFDAALPAQIQALYDSIAASAQADAVRWNYSVGQRKDLQLPTYAAART